MRTVLALCAKSLAELVALLGPVLALVVRVTPPGLKVALVAFVAVPVLVGVLAVQLVLLVPVMLFAALERQ